MVPEFVEKDIFSIQCPRDLDFDLDPFAHLHTTIDNVAKVCGSWKINSGIKPCDENLLTTHGRSDTH